MIDIRFDYRGNAMCVVAPSESDDIASRILQQRTFYEFDVLERCEKYAQRRQHGTILDIGAFIGNHTVFFARFCGAREVLAFEACKSSFDILLQTIVRNGLPNVSAYNVAVGETAGWGAVAIRDPENLGANRVQSATDRSSGAVRLVALDLFLETVGKSDDRVALVKIDVEGMECEVLRGAARTLARWKPVLCVEILDGAHMRHVLDVFRPWRYLIRECNGAAPTYIAAWEERIPRPLIRLLNFGWLLLARYGNNLWRWRYRRIIELALPV